MIMFELSWTSRNILYLSFPQRGHLVLPPVFWIKIFPSSVEEFIFVERSSPGETLLVDSEYSLGGEETTFGEDVEISFGSSFTGMGGSAGGGGVISFGTSLGSSLGAAGGDVTGGSLDGHGWTVSCWDSYWVNHRGVSTSD